MHNRNNQRLNSLFVFQGIYFVVTGVWPVLNIASFITATGPKQDIWLVQMIGLLAVSIGLTFLQAALRGRDLPTFLGYTVSFSFLIMNIICVSNGTADRIYLIDAAIQLLFLLLLSALLFMKRRS